MRIGKELKRLRGESQATREFYKELSEATGIDISRLRKLSADQANVTQYELSQIRTYCNLPDSWPSGLTVLSDNVIIDASPTLLLTLINSIADPGTPDTVRKSLARELERTLGLVN